MKKLYSEKEIKESYIKVKRLLPDSDAMESNVYFTNSNS